ncbi:BNR repeat-like domain-containing protein [Stachybotrys elegans]|uniref:BNR repeat-like domain-containing protein n=1 Tax=Stachybotrys elegans TaxID=80388 RepID=A0A8K0STZ5_9HYPO|nr:BNR repeat-like domain-containing protein [Stachybotrys elegans]
MSSPAAMLRIPSATVQCHASNLLQLPDKTLLCAFFGGSQEGLPDISIWLSRLKPGSTSWTEPEKVSYDDGRSCQNPVLFRDPINGRIWLFHMSQDAGNQDGAYMLARTSKDNGITWSHATRPLGDKKGVFTRQPVVVRHDGTWVLPVFYCRSEPGYRWIGSNDISGIFYSKDQGKTWHEKQLLDGIGACHMNILKPASQGSPWVAFFRSRWADNVYRATSSDGLDWDTPRPTTLLNPNSGICAARLASGRIAIVFNDSAASPESLKREGLYDDITPEDDKRPNQEAVGGKQAIWGTPRKRLSVGISDDEGLTWRVRILEDGDGYCMTNSSTGQENRELSYPSIWADAQNGKDVVHVAFTFHRQYIKYAYIEDLDKWMGA